MIQIIGLARLPRYNHAMDDIRSLLTPACFDHPVKHLKLLETHISWIILTGPFAYKLKKPVNFGFLDYSTLQRRLYFCHEELRLNRRLAPDVYLDVVRLGGEPAVKMREFPQDRMLDRMVILPWHVDSIADQVARFHLSLPAAKAGSAWGTPHAVHAPVRENFDQLLPHAGELPLRAWSEKEFQRLRPLLSERQRRGFIRECHGDLHLRNMFETPTGVTIFDGIEFNPNLSWIDVISEVAFLVMDLEHRGYPALGYRFLNRYLELTGDYGGLAVLDYYLVYRALVRAKVEAFSHSPAWREYLQLATRLARPRTPRLLITHGVSGSGKTFQSQRLLEREGWIRLRSDVERKRLFGLAAQAASDSPLGAGIYSRDAGELTYARLLALSRHLLCAGFPVLIDATFLARSQRDPFRQLARELDVPFSILDLEVDPEVARERLRARGGDASEADEAVLARQLERYVPLDESELGMAQTAGTR